jgi:chromosome segregation ATPase
LKGLGTRYGSITSAQIHKKMAGRSKRSQLMDRSLQAKRVGSIRKKKDRVDWAEHPESMDLQGVDTKIADDQYQAKFSKQLLKEKRQQRRKLTKQIYKKKEQVKRVEKPKEQKEIKEEIKEVEEQKEQVEQDIKNVEVGHRKLKKSIHEKAEEKREVLYVMKTTQNNNYVESRALIERAKNKGIAYDRVDWDQLQGADLTYGDRVRRLDAQIGKTFTDEEFYSPQYGEKYDQMYEDWAAREGYPL